MTAAMLRVERCPVAPFVHAQGLGAVVGDVDREAALFEQANGDLLVHGVVLRDEVSAHDEGADTHHAQAGRRRLDRRAR